MDEFKAAVVILLILIAMVGGATIISKTIEMYMCTLKGSSAGVEMRGDWLMGCLVHTKEGTWIPFNQYRVIE